jgi:UDP-GlcNAc:undecaprenyl-phosphate GlcNAc-1-phosphate transferase
MAFVMSVGLVAALLPVGLRIGLVDLPDQDLKTHGRRVPIVGGIAVFITVNFVLANADRFDLGFFAVGLAMLILGHYDDIKGLSPGVRIMAAAIAGGLLAVVSGLPFSVSLYIASVIVVVAVNSVNLLDGADGVAGSAAIGTSFGIAILATGRGLDSVPSLILGSALCGFLVFNWPKSRAFLGDGGAYLVGISLTFLMLHSTSPPESQASESG